MSFSYYYLIPLRKTDETPAPVGVMDLDGIDEGILYLLQRDARRITTKEMTEQVGVSASTVRNRIDRLEEAE